MTGTTQSPDQGLEKSNEAAACNEHAPLSLKGYYTPASKIIKIKNTCLHLSQRTFSEQSCFSCCLSGNSCGVSFHAVVGKVFGVVAAFSCKLLIYLLVQLL